MIAIILAPYNVPHKYVIRTANDPIIRHQDNFSLTIMFDVWVWPAQGEQINRKLIRIVFFQIITKEIEYINIYITPWNEHFTLGACDDKSPHLKNQWVLKNCHQVRFFLVIRVLSYKKPKIPSPIIAFY